MASRRASAVRRADFLLCVNSRRCHKGIITGILGGFGQDLEGRSAPSASLTANIRQSHQSGKEASRARRDLIGFDGSVRSSARKSGRHPPVAEQRAGDDFYMTLFDSFSLFFGGGGVAWEGGWIKVGLKSDGVRWEGWGRGIRHKPNRQCERSSGYFSHVIKTLSSAADSLALRPAISHLASLRCPPESSAPNPRWHCGPRTIPTAAAAASARFPPHLELKWSVPVLP